jgi:hypothetical protein
MVGDKEGGKSALVVSLCAKMELLPVGEPPSARDRACLHACFAVAPTKVQLQDGRDSKTGDTSPWKANPASKREAQARGPAITFGTRNRNRRSSESTCPSMTSLPHPLPREQTTRPSNTSMPQSCRGESCETRSALFVRCVLLRVPFINCELAFHRNSLFSFGFGVFAILLGPDFFEETFVFFG